MEKRALALALVLSLAIVGITLYALEVLQTKKLSYTYEELAQMDKEALIAVIMENQAKEGGLGRYVFPLAVVLSSLAVLAVTYYVLSKERIRKEDVLALLRPDERKILEALATSGGSLKQYELTAITKLNKVKVHRVLRELEQRGVVEVYRVGKYNIVRLSKELEKLFR